MSPFLAAFLALSPFLASAWMKQALVNWYAAMQKAGLLAEGDNDMEQFARHGLRGLKE
jgi:hypothetical protein